MMKSNLEGSNTEDIEATFEEVVTPRKRRKLDKSEGTGKLKKRSTFDLDNYVPYKPTDDHYEKG